MIIIVKIAKFVSNTRALIKQKRKNTINMFVFFNDISFSLEFKM